MSERTMVSALAPVNDDRLSVRRAPCLVALGPDDRERVVFLDETGGEATLIGREDPCQVLLPDPSVSRRHAQVRMQGQRAELVDLGSTNGILRGAEKVRGWTLLSGGETVQIGRYLITLDWRERSRAEAAEQVARELERASRYVEAQLPPRIAEGPIRLDWAFHPSAKLGGDVFGYHQIDATRVAGYLIDVSGHGVGAAMHSTAILSTLRKQALPDTDFTDPAAVLTRLNDSFDMDDHDGFCFTIWYGVFDGTTRRMRYASGGHHAALLMMPGAETPVELRTRNPVMGALPGARFRCDEAEVPPGSRLHVFSDGCFEVETRSGAPFDLAGFALLLRGLAPNAPVSGLYHTVRGLARPGPLADDFTVMSVTFA